jgi:hypothetical protein
LSRDLGAISNLLADATADRQLGTPLTGSEVKLMQARAKIQRDLQPLRNRLFESPDDFAGLWLSYPIGGTTSNALTVNVNVVSGKETAAFDLRSLVPENAALQLHSVASSQRQLQDSA